MRVLVLGAYGLIGKAVSIHLSKTGYDVVGLARSEKKGRALVPDIDWIGADISTLVTPESWRPKLRGIDVVVNASGALQNGSRDRLAAVQRDAIIALGRACEAEGIQRLVQVSAPRAETTATTEFLRTKAQADEALLESSLDVVVLKPGLVLAPTAYGGTGLLRVLAAVPVVQPMVLPDAKVQSIWIDDLAKAIVIAVRGEVPKGAYDLGEESGHSLEDTILRFRSWLGFSKPKAILRLPLWLGYTISKFADAAGWLGWRSPLRTTALKVLEEGVVTDASRWTEWSSTRFRSLDQFLSEMPATAQERIYARAQLVFPILLTLLSTFWIISGVIGLFRLNAAAEILQPQISDTLARTFVVSGSLVDIIIGAGLLVRNWVRGAAIASVIVALAYMIAGTIVTPHLWLDPLGPFVKIIPALGMGLIVASLAEER